MGSNCYLDSAEMKSPIGKNSPLDKAEWKSLNRSKFPLYTAEMKGLFRLNCPLDTADTECFITSINTLIQNRSKVSSDQIVTLTY